MENKDFPIQVDVSFDFESKKDSIKNYCNVFIQNYNETWDTNYTYDDLSKGREDHFYTQMKDYLQEAIQDMIQQELEDEFLNYLNYSLNRLKTKKELGL